MTKTVKTMEDTTVISSMVAVGMLWIDSLCVYFESHIDQPAN